MDLKSEVLEMKKEVSKVKEQSLAMEIISDYKKANKRLFIVWIITFTALVGMCCYTVYLLNDISSVETTTQEVSDIDTIGGSVVNNGDVYGEN